MRRGWNSQKSSEEYSSNAPLLGPAQAQLHNSQQRKCDDVYVADNTENTYAVRQLRERMQIS